MVLKRGYIIDYLTGKPVKDTPEERVRQAVLRSLVEEYGYEKRDIEKEYEIPMGRARKRADLVVKPNCHNHGKGHRDIPCPETIETE